MQYAPARRALAGSVLVLGSVGTVSAVHLDAAPVPASPDGRSAAAMAPPALPDTRSAAPDAPSLDAPAASAPAHSGRASTPRRSRSSDRPVSTRDLIDMAHGPRGGDAVLVPVHDIERTVPLRSVGIGRRGVLGGGLGDGLRSLDDVLDFDRSDRADFGWSDSDSDWTDSDSDWADSDTAHNHDRTRGGYHRADVSWDSGDVSYSRPRCGGRHRAS